MAVRAFKAAGHAGAGAGADGVDGGAATIALAQAGRAFRVAGETIWALRPLDLTVEAGDFVAIMGTSGSGKSTLLNLLGLLDRPSEGRYRLLGQDTAALDDDARATLRGRTLGFVFQSFNLLPRTTALENVGLPLLYHGVPRAQRDARARTALEEVGLGARLMHVPAQLSGGQQQRVALARALVGQPKLLLADEPTGNLDSKTSLEVMATLQALNAAGLTTVLVTHEREVALCARRILLFRDGRKVGDERLEPQQRRQAAAELAALARPDAERGAP